MTQQFTFELRNLGNAIYIDFLCDKAFFVQDYSPKVLDLFRFCCFKVDFRPQLFWSIKQRIYRMAKSCLCCLMIDRLFQQLIFFFDLFNFLVELISKFHLFDFDGIYSVPCKHLTGLSFLCMFKNIVDQFLLHFSFALVRDMLNKALRQLYMLGLSHLLFT